jgi:hypothetical protein
MINEEVFLLVEVTSLDNSHWLARGRAYGDVRVGDVIFPSTDQTAALPFRVTAITTYGRRVDELGRMMTGDLTLEGAHGEHLGRARTLVRRLEPSGAVASVPDQRQGSN